MAAKYAAMSQYGYCAGNPVNYDDPYGMEIGERNTVNQKYKGAIRGHLGLQKLKTQKGW